MEKAGIHSAHDHTVSISDTNEIQNDYLETEKYDKGLFFKESLSAEKNIIHRPQVADFCIFLLCVIFIPL
jgi:hypothetical protein